VGCVVEPPISMVVVVTSLTSRVAGGRTFGPESTRAIEHDASATPRTTAATAVVSVWR